MNAPDESNANAYERLKADIKIGIDQLDRGEGEPLDMDEIRAEIRRRLDARQINAD